MLDWSYDYVKQRHAEERVKREADARFFVEKWLEALVGPCLTKRGPLPLRFQDKLSYYSSSEDKFCAAEVTSMANKLGWCIQVEPGPLVTIWQTLKTHEPTIDSKWDLAAVRAQKKLNNEEYLKDAGAVISKAVEPFIGKPNLPSSFLLDVSANWIKEHSEDLVVLGWCVDTSVAGSFYLRKA